MGSKKITKNGYEISQASNNHVMICKNGKMVYHASMGYKMSENELLKQLEVFEMLTKEIKEMVLNGTGDNPKGLIEDLYKRSDK